MLVELQQKGHVAGYRSVLRTFISAFIASYEINLRLDDITLNLIFDILCKNISMRGVSLQSVLE